MGKWTDVSLITSCWDGTSIPRVSESDMDVISIGVFAIKGRGVL